MKITDQELNQRAGCSRKDVRARDGAGDKGGGMIERLCINCKYCKHGVNRAETAHTYWCDHPLNRSKVDGLPQSTCEALRNCQVHGCAEMGCWFMAKEEVLPQPPT